MTIAGKSRLLLLIGSMAIMLCACSGQSAQDLVNGAKRLIETKDNSAAVIELKNALQHDPNLAEARFLLGRLLLDGGNAVGAEIELRKAQELGYASDQVVPLLAKALVRRGESRKLIEQFSRQSLQDGRAQADLQVSLARAFSAEGKASDARSAIEAALQADPGQVDARLLQVRMLMTERNVSAAAQILDKAIEMAPANSEARQLRGDLLLLGGDQEAALLAYKEAIERDKRNIGAHAAVLRILLGRKDQLASAEAQLQALRSAAPQHPQTRFFTALMAFEKGDFEVADEQVQILLKQAPEYGPGLLLAGSIALRKGALVQAEAAFLKALNLMPDSTRTKLLLAQTELRMGDAAKASRLLQPMVEMAEPQWEPVALMAQAQLMIGDMEKAQGYFAQAAKLNPQDTRSRTAVALSHVAKGQTRGIDELRSIAETDPGPLADLAMITTLLRRKNVEGALAAIARLEKKQPKSPTASYLRGRAEMMRDARPQARAAFEAALAIDPGYAPAADSLAAMDIADGKSGQARQRFERRLAAEPGDARAAMSLLRIRAQEGASQDELATLLAATIKAAPTEPSPRLALVALKMGQKDYKAAAALAEEALTVVPDNPDLLDAQGQAQYLGGEVNQAIATYNKLAALRANSPVPHVRLAQVQLAANAPSLAAQHFRKALAIKPDYLPALRGLIGVELSAGRKDNALGVARSVQSLRGSEAIGLALEGDVEGHQKNWAAAAKAYRGALDKQESPEIAIKLHQALLAAKQFDEAQRLEQRWRKQYPQDTAFLVHLGDWALNQGNYTQAQQQYESVLRQNPDHALALNNVAWLLNHAKKPDALNFALKANKLAPRQPAFMDTLAEIYASNGQLAKAVETQEAAVAAAPEFSLHRLHLAKYYVAANEKIKAKQELDKLLALGEKFDRQAEVRAMLATLN